MEEYQTTEFKAYDTVMKEYVLIPDQVLIEVKRIADVLDESYHFVMSLKSR